MDELSQAVDLVPLGVIEQLNRAEVDIQISTAHKFPRSMTNFQREALSLVTLHESVAQECTYTLPRGGKDITGPSARFAEILASSWGNCRAGARIVEIGDRYVRAQGVFHDLQRNVAVTYEVQRRITDKDGKRYNDDMVTAACNASCAIAIRNAVLKGIPKAIWQPVYLAAVKTAKGDQKTLPTRRKAILEAFAALGIPEDQVFRLAEVKSAQDIDLEVLFKLSGIITAVEDGDVSRETLLGASAPKAPAPPAQRKAPAPADSGRIEEPGPAEVEPLDHDPETGEVRDEAPAPEEPEEAPAEVVEAPAPRAAPKPPARNLANAGAQQGPAPAVPVPPKATPAKPPVQKAAPLKPPAPAPAPAHLKAPQWSEEEAMRPPREVMNEVEAALSEAGDESEIDYLSVQYRAHPALTFPGDKSRLMGLIATARERLTS